MGGISSSLSLFKIGDHQGPNNIILSCPLQKQYLLNIAVNSVGAFFILAFLHSAIHQRKHKGNCEKRLFCCIKEENKKLTDRPDFGRRQHILWVNRKIIIYAATQGGGGR